MNFIKCVKCGQEDPAFDYAHLCGPVEVKQTVMNERIRELAEKAGMVIVNDQFSTYGKFAEKFARLIVAECIQVSEAHAKDLESQPTDPLLEAYEDGVVNGIYEATEAIKEHFGVER